MICPRPISLIALALAASGCATTQPVTRVQTQTVEVPVPTTCVPSTLDPPPTYPDTDAALKAAPDAASRYLLLIEGRVLRVARANLLESIVTGCR